MLSWIKRVDTTEIIFFILFTFTFYAQKTIASEQLSFVGADGADGTFGVNLGGFAYIGNLSESGINFYGIEQIRWGYIEPSPPLRKGEHTYDWSKLDQIIRKIEEVNGHAFITIICTSKWATKRKDGSRVASPPEDGYWDYYRDFVKTLVERYDNDGNSDMPGLKYAHLYYQIEDEAENPSSWDGTENEYLKLLRTAKEGARQANPDVKIFTFSPNLGDFFDHLTNKEAQDKAKLMLEQQDELYQKRKDKVTSSRAARKISFIRTIMGEYDAYDFISIQYNYHYTGLHGIIDFIRRFSNKPIWVADAASATLLGRHQRLKAEYTKNKHPYLSEKEIAGILSNSHHPRYKEINEWWEAEKARITFKKIITAASLGIEHIFIQFILDMESNPLDGDEAGVNPWNYSGLLGKDGKSRPVVNMIRLFNEKLKGFSKVEDISQREGNSSDDWIMHYRFTIGMKKIDVIWTDGADKKYNLTNRKVSVTHIIESTDSMAKVETVDGSKLIISRRPVIVETE